MTGIEHMLGVRRRRLLPTASYALALIKSGRRERAHGRISLDPDARTRRA